MMQKHWQLRDALYRAFHNWPFLVGMFLLGGLLGWLAGMIWPAYHKATQETYVGLNPYRTYSDERFLALAKPRYSNIDNYHYWQMYQLEAAIYRDVAVQATLERLRAADPAWEAVTAEELRSMLRAEWRTAGIWKLAASHPDPQMAAEAVQAWSAAAGETVQVAVAASRRLLALDQQMAQSTAAVLEAEGRLQGLQSSEKGLRGWIAQSDRLAPDQPLPPADRWQIFSLVVAYSGDDAAWSELLAARPEADAAASAYRQWAEAALGRIQTDLAVLPDRVAALQSAQQALEIEYDEAAEASLGLSPNIELEGYGAVESQAVRPASTLALIGAFLGLVGWLAAQLVRITRSGQAALEPGRG